MANASCQGFQHTVLIAFFIDVVAHFDSWSTHAFLPYIPPNHLWVMTSIIAVVAHIDFRVKHARSGKLLPTILYNWAPQGHS